MRRRFDVICLLGIWPPLVAHDVEMTSMRRRFVDAKSFRRHMPAGNLAPPGSPPPQYSKPWPHQYSKPSYAYDNQTRTASLACQHQIY